VSERWRRGGVVDFLDCHTSAVVESAVGKMAKMAKMATHAPDLENGPNT
jgi:hypothetical protein